MCNSFTINVHANKHISMWLQFVWKQLPCQFVNWCTNSVTCPNAPVWKLFCLNSLIFDCLPYWLAIINSSSMCACCNASCIFLLWSENHLSLQAMPFTHKLEMKYKSQEPILFFEFLRNSIVNLFILSRYRMNYLEFRVNQTVLDGKKLFSLPGQLDVAYFTNFHSILNIYWVYDIYKQHLNLMRMFITNCDTDLPSHLTCLNLSSGAQVTGDKDSYMLLTKHVPHIFLPLHSPNFSALENFLLTGTNLTSWEEASTLCTDLGGMLPIFDRKEKLEEVIALLKFVEDIPPVEGIFIGLKLTKSQQVPFSCKQPHNLQGWGQFCTQLSCINAIYHEADFISLHFFADRALLSSGLIMSQWLTRCFTILIMVNTISSTTFATRDSIGSMSMSIFVPIW